MSAAAAPRDWKKLVEESDGQLVFVPETLVPMFKEWAALHAEFNKELARLSKLEVTKTTKLNNFFFALREYYENAGVKDVWQKDVSVETNALAEGENVIVITTPKTL